MSALLDYTNSHAREIQAVVKRADEETVAKVLAGAESGALGPQARDGFVVWGLLDDTLRELGAAEREVTYPIFKVRREAK